MRAIAVRFTLKAGSANGLVYTLFSGFTDTHSARHGRLWARVPMGREAKIAISFGYTFNTVSGNRTRC
jgi:hypothetical protein